MPITLAVTHPSSIGVTVIPACVALVPSTDWTNSGMNEMLPNMAHPVRTPCSTAVVNNPSLKRGIGRIGSAALISTRSKAAVSRAAAAQVKIADANKNLQQQKIENEVVLAYKKWKDAVDNHKLLNQAKINKFREVEKGVLMNFRHGNLSLIEFTDFMENYNQTLMQYHRFAKDLVTSCEEINYITNSTQF